MTQTATAPAAPIAVGGYVRDLIDDEVGFVASIQDGGFGVIWPGDITPKYAAADEVEAAEYPSEDDREPVTEVHNIDVFSSGGGSDGPRRHVPFCLTCNRALGGVMYDYGQALDICTSHRNGEDR